MKLAYHVIAGYWSLFESLIEWSFQEMYSDVLVKWVVYSRLITPLCGLYLWGEGWFKLPNTNLCRQDSKHT